MTEWIEGMAVRRAWLFPATGLGLRRYVNYLSFAVTSLPTMLTGRRPDLLFVESPPLTLLPSAVLASRIWRTPLVMFVADLWPDSAVDLGALESGWVLASARGLERWSYRMVDSVSVPTLGLLQRLESKGVARRRLTFLPNGVDTEMFSPRPPDGEMSASLGLDPSERAVLYAGTVGTVHGLDVAIEAMKRLQGTHPDVRLIVVGAGSDLDRIRNLVRTEGLTNVTFLPPQPLEQIARTWTLAEVGLSTLRNLPLAQATRPAKMLAAMASGKPVVYAGEGEGARLLTDADAGIIVRPEDPAGLADAIARLLDDPRFAGELGMNGRTYVEHHLTWRAIVDRWLDELPGTGPRIAKAFRE